MRENGHAERLSHAPLTSDLIPAELEWRREEKRGEEKRGEERRAETRTRKARHVILNLPPLPSPAFA